jgi:hypothetical protein
MVDKPPIQFFLGEDDDQVVDLGVSYFQTNSSSFKSLNVGYGQDYMDNMS